MTRIILAAPLFFAAACTNDTIVQQNVPARSISVTGEGAVSAVPDLAILTFSVVTRDKEAGAAFTAASERMNAVLAAIEEQGVEARDRQTGRIGLDPVYGQDGNYRDRSRIEAYEASNTLIVRLRNIELAGNVIDAAVRAGANGLDSFRLTFDDPAALEEEARIAAVRDAASKARAMADAAGARLGEVISLSVGGGSPRPQPVMMRSMAMEDAAVPTISAGEQDVRVTVSATFALK